MVTSQSRPSCSLCCSLRLSRRWCCDCEGDTASADQVASLYRGGGGSVLTEIIYEAIGSVWLGWLGYVLSLIGLIGFPISIGIAIVRYRLYEIDTLINRTLVYALLTAILAAVYFGAVVLLQRLFVALTGEKSPPSRT